MQRPCRAKIVATLGPASSSAEVIGALIEAGADVFRLNFSPGLHEDHRARYEVSRQLQERAGRPVGPQSPLA